MIDLQRNLAAVQNRIQRAAEQAGREPREITVVAVSKTFPAESVLAAYELGVRNFGENRVEEATEKIPHADRLLGTRRVTWHMIGHLQRRKAKDAISLFDMIHSVDSVSLALRLDGLAALREKRIPVLLEVNVSGEKTKSGFECQARDEFVSAVNGILALEHLDVQGLMTIAPIVDHPDAARPYFRTLRERRDELQARCNRPLPHLSMGMTDDFEAAIAEGATIIRIGRAIFGERA